MNAPRRLLTSIHDVTPYHTDRLDRLVPLIEEGVGTGRFALLVVPDFHRTGLATENAAFVRRLRQWADDGCEIFLHGFTHVDESHHATKSAQIKAQRMTAGEGEFLGLSYEDACMRLTAGRTMLEDALGRPVAGFIAPAWLYGAESRRAISDMNFALAEDHFRVWRPKDNAILTHGPVVTYASRSLPRLVSSILWSRLATLALVRAQTVRFAVHPHDVDSPHLIKEIRRAMGSFVRSHTPASYADLAANR
jgi:uncharacterized protein